MQKGSRTAINTLCLVCFLFEPRDNRSLGTVVEAYAIPKAFRSLPSSLCVRRFAKVETCDLPTGKVFDTYGRSWRADRFIRCSMTNGDFRVAIIRT